MTDASITTQSTKGAEGEAEFGDFFALLKPRVMSLVVFTALVGVLAGYFKALDGMLMRLTDLFLALPLLPLLLVIIMLFRQPLNTAFGPEGGIFILMVSAIGITSWMQAARIVRGEVLAL